MKRNYSPIQRKLMRIVLVTTGVVLFLTCTGFFAYEFYTTRQNTKDRLATLGEIISHNSTAALAFEDYEVAQETLSALRVEKNIVLAALYDARGNLFAKYPEFQGTKFFPVHPSADGYNYTGGGLEGFQPVIQSKKRVGTLYLQSDMKAFYDRFIRYGMIALTVVLISFLVAFLLSNQLQKTISRPILSLAETAGYISNENDYSVRARKFGDDELGVLTDAFNKMLEQIERQNDEITSFNHALELKVNDRTNQLEQANNELKLKNEFVETIIESTVDVIAVFDKELNYVVLNKYGKEVYQTGNGNIIGRNLFEVFPNVRNGEMHEDLKQSLQGNTVHNLYYKSRISNRVLENFYIPLKDKDETVYRVLVIGHDITEISEANEKLKALNNALGKSNSDLEQFAYIASHDLQEPLRKIQTFSQLVGKNLDDKESAKKYLSKIYSSGARMTDLIKAVLNYSKLSNEKVQFEVVDLNEVIENIKTDLELTIVEKEAEIYVDQLPVLPGNKLQLSQLFLNLISNSLKFSREKPLISISCNVDVSNDMKLSDGIDVNERYAEIVVKDNGIGFEQHYADKVFNVFQRLHSREDFPGTGIGLALCKKIIENHLGSISVESKPGEGTTFTIYLPMQHSAVPMQHSMT